MKEFSNSQISSKSISRLYKNLILGQSQLTFLAFFHKTRQITPYMMFLSHQLISIALDMGFKISAQINYQESCQVVRLAFKWTLN